MPIYKYNGQTYDIPDNVVSDFEKKRPDATIAYQVDGNIYDIPLAKREGFLSKYPSASLYQEKVEQAKEIDPFQPESVAKPLYTDFSYQESVANQENSQYYPSPLNEEGRAETEPMSYEDRSRQEYEMLMRQLEEFDAVNGNMMDTYEAYEKAARHQINEGGFALDTMEREYLDANSGEYRARKQERDALNERIKNNSYFNQMRMSEADAANEAVDAISDLMAQNEAENTELHKKMKAMNALAMNPRGSFSGFSKTKEMQEYVDERDDLLTAKRLYENTAQVYAAPINDGEDVLKKFGQGFVQRGDDLDFWTMGIVGIADDMNARAAFQKIQDKFGSVKELANLTDAEIDALLTPSEQLLISAVMDNNAALYARKDNTAGAYEAGAGAADSLMFMAQFLLTGGVGDAATVGTAAHRRLVNWLGRKVGSMSNGLMKDVARGAVKLGVGTAESIGKALVMTPLMPHTYANIADNIMSFDDKGELMDVTDAILTGAADALIETWSESTGDFVNKVLGVPGDITKGIAKKALKNVDFSDWGRMANAPIMKILRKGGFNGFLGEMGEEFIGNAVRSISGLEPDAFKEFTKLENLLVTAGSFAPMTIFGLGVSGAQYGWQKRKLDNAQKAFEAMLREASYTEDQARFVIDELLGSTDAHLTPEKLVANFSPLLRELAFNDKFANNRTQALNSAIDLMWQIARYRTFDGVYHRQEEQQRNDMLAEIQEGTGREFWTTRLSENAGLDGTAYETDEVRAVEFNDGRVAYVLGGDGVNNTVVYNDGQTGFLSEEQLNEGKANGSIVSDATMGLNDYLTQQVARVRMTEEEQRMFAERNTNIGQVRAQFPIDATVELGTTEAPIQGVVRQQTPNGVIVESPAGVSQLTWEELGHTIGIEVNPQTDAQMEEEAINNLEIADLQRRRAREQRRAQRNAAAEAVLTEEQMVDEAENEGLEKPIPMKADGTVDQTAFWNESPARWAQWKTEQRQDGGAYASTYIQNAIGILEGQIAESEAAFLAESDFDAKDALEQTINQQRARLAELQDLAMQYTPAVIPAETSAEASAEQTQPGAETSQPAVMAERQKFELDAEYQRRLSLARALAEKEMILKEYFEAISAGSMEAVVMNKQNYKQIMKENGCSEDDIEMVTSAIKFAEEENKAVDALHVNDKIFIVSDYVASIEGGRVSYVHERQHNITKNRPELIQRILSLGLGRETMQKIVRMLSGSEFYEKKSDDVLADEMLSFTMEIAYTFDDFSVTLSKLGLPIELINLINEINDEQRKDFTLVNARRNSNALDSGQRDSGQNDGDSGEVSGGILGQEGVRPSEDSERRDEARESGEPATGGAEASEEGLQVPVAEVDEESEEDPETILNEDGFEADEQNEDVRFSVRYLPTPEQREGIIDSIIQITGRTREEAERWLESELSLVPIVLNDKEYLDYAPDSKYKAIKDNSDYPQGTVDFNNICRKRKDFTRMYTRLQRAYPNRIFTAEDLADIRTIMSEDGLVVACGLCYVEDRRQKLGEVADEFIKDLQDGFKNYGKKNATKRANAEKFRSFVGADTYVPSIYDLITLEGSDKLHDEHKGIWDAFGAYNRARGQQTQNTFQGYAEYKREILTWSDAKVKKVNSLGGLRIFSYSDFEAHHLLDIIQIIIDCSARGVMIQGYTKVPEFARVVEKTGIKLNRSLIPLGDTGIVDGKLAYDPVEGIDINDPNFLESNDNVGNILIGINDEQIRMAMADPFIHYIIPYHARQAGNIRAKLNVGAWTNYIDTQNERKKSDGKRVEKNINIYTDVLNESITNDREFVEKYLEVCREKGYIPKFDQFLDRDAEGNYVYTPGYYKFLVDFKLFDEAGNILPQKPVVAQFDDAFNAQVLLDYAREERETAGEAMNSTYDKIVETLDLGEPTVGEDVRFRASEGPIDLVEEARKAQAKHDAKESDVRFRVLDTTNAELKEKPIKLNGMYRFKLKNAFKGVKDNGGSYPYIKVQLEEVSDDYSGEKIEYNGILEGFAVVRIPKGLITEGEKDNVFFIDPKAIENELWDVLRATENYYEFKHGGAPYQHDWMNAEVRFRITPEQDKAYMDAVEAGDMETAQRMVDAAAAAAGYTIRGDHGRVSKFTIFDRDKANPEGNWGQGFYFTNNEEDVENNYATVEGPDLEAKIEREVEKRVGIAEMNEEFNEDGEVDEFAIREEVEKEFITSEPNIVHAAIKMDKPFVVGHGMVVSDEAGNTSYDMQETYLDVEYEYDEDGEIDYYSEPTGTLIDLIDALNEEISNYDWANFNANEILQDAYDGMTASQFESAARELLNSHIDELVNDRGDVMTSEILRAAIERAGFDGIIDNTVNQKFGTQRRYGQSMAGMDSDTRHYISFDSSNIKDTDPVTYDDKGNVIPLSERFNPENDDIRFRMSNENQAIFVSNAARAVEGIKQEKATPEQWLKMIEKAGGLKAGEDKWMGLSDWLKASDKKTLTKQEVLDYINENMIVIEEQHYEEDALDVEALWYKYEESEEGVDAINYQMQLDAEAYAERELADSDLEGEEWEQEYERLVSDYIEDDLFGSARSAAKDAVRDLWMEEEAPKLMKGASREINSTRINYTTEGLDNLHEIALTVPTIESWNESDDIHFGDAGDGRAVAWIRFGETEVPTGEYKVLLDEMNRLKEVARELYEEFGGRSNELAEVEERQDELRAEMRSYKNPGLKVLVIDEIQSKRHQEGREKGYKTLTMEERAKGYRKLIDAHDELYESLEEKYGRPFELASSEEDYKEIMSPEDFDALNTARQALSDARLEMRALKHAVPDAPFNKNWHELAMKRMLRYAAENGYDVIAWTTGDQQNQRYGLSKVVDHIQVGMDFTKNVESSFRMYLKNGNDHHVGVNRETGLVTFYNENPQAIGKPLSDVLGKELADKVLGARDYQIFTEVDFELSEGMRGFYDKMLPAFMNKYGKRWGVKVEDIELPNLEDGLTMHSIPVTEEMKASVMEGQVMFRMRGENETAEEFVNGIIDDFKAKYNAFNEIIALDPTSKTQVAKFIGVSEEDISDEDMASFLKELEERDSRGWYNNKRIAIFVRKNVTDGKKSELVLIHENIHAINKEHPDLIAIGEYLWNTAQKGTREYKYKMAIAKAYPESEWFDEMSAYVVSEYMQDEQIDKLKSLLDSDNIESLNKLLNISGYGKDRSKQRPRVTWNVLRKRPSETTEESGRTEEGGEPGDLRFRTTEITPEVREEMDAIHASAILMGNFMKAPNGQPTNLTEEQWLMVRTENFINWFGDWINDPANASKIVDENGEPMVMIHGSQNKFSVFRRGRGPHGMSGRGMYFGRAPKDIDSFSYGGASGQKYLVFLNVRNLYDATKYRIDRKLRSNDVGKLIPKDVMDEIIGTSSYDEFVESVTDINKARFASSQSIVKDISKKTYQRIHDSFDGKGMFTSKENVVKRIFRKNRTYLTLNHDFIGEIVVRDPNQIKSATDNNGEFNPENEDIRFRVRTKPAPKKTGKGYKVFYLKDGKLYPPMVANLGGVDTPVGVWLDAEEGTRAGVSKTGRPQVKQGGKGTQGGSGTLAYRPGWHLGEIPYAIQFNRKDENGNRTLFPADFVWAEVEYANDVDYQEEAMSYGMNANGKFQHSLAGLPKLPIDGSYRYRTNPNPETDPWIITGAMKVNRLLTPSEVDQMVVDAGREPQKRQEGAVTDEQIEALNKELGLVEEEEEVSFRTTGTPTEDVVAEGVSLSPAQLASLAGDIFSALPEDGRKKITDGLNGNILGLQDAILQIPTSLATKEEWSDEDRQMAEVVAEQMTKAVGIEMTRPFSASEALWTLYNAVNKSTDLVSEASRALVRRNLGFDSQTLEMEKDARDGVRFRTVGNASANAQASMYNRGAANVWTRLKESFVDMHASVEELVKAIEKRSGKVAQGFENILMALNQQSSKGLAAMEAYEQKFLNKMFDEIRDIMNKTDFKYEDIVRYVILKHGLERNIKLAQRDAMAHYQEIYDDIIAKIKGMNPAQKRTYLTNAQLRDADAKAELAVLQGVNTSALTTDQLRDHKKALAKAKKEAAEAAEHLVRAQKIATMTEQDAQDELDKIFKKIEKGTDSVYKEMRKNDYSGISSMFYDTLGVDRKNYATEEEYQAALMQAKADKYDTLGDIEGAAQMEVTLFENAVNTDNLWKSINKATKETLRQQYEANMISKDQYENLRNMFEFYVPLRGFADNTAEDMYTYYRRPNSTGYTKPILGAEGRKTEAESPFGWIAAMAGSAIASNVKNEAKLALYYFVANRPDNGIATLSRTWFVHTPGDVDANGKKIFRPAYPPFNQDLSTDAAKQAYEDWQEQMRDLQKQGLAYEAGQRLNLGNAVVNISDTNKPEHIVNVKVGGKDYTIVINGNPRAAQAINGDLNIESSAQDYSTVFGPMLRWMSSVNTSYNPEFWVTNMMRDMAFTMMAVNIKEDPAYRRKFFKNYAKAFKVISMVAKNEKGTLGNKYIENMYKDFVKYGGVTGYTQIKDSETWEKEIENYLASNDPSSLRNGEIMRGMKSFFHGAHRFGESLEQVSRFAAFLTAVETGKSINEAINDAKEITVNFNRKGSGKMITLEEAKYLTDKNGQPLNKLEQWAVVGISSIAPLGRRMIMFFNAAIQGLNATYKLYAENKTRAIGWALGYAAVGMINAVLHAMFDDDDDYLDIPQYERRNSLMIGWNGAYIKWALPQEARAFYALGDLAVESVMGRNPHQNVIGEALKISTEILPVNPSEGWKAFMPSVAVPLVELALNEDYKGAPIYNEQKWLTEEERKRSTKWSKAYSGTGDLYIGIAKVLNAVTGGDEHDAGLINLQPEKMEHLVQSAFGGTIRTADKFINSIMAAFDPEEDVTVRQFPFLNRILTINDERYKNVHVNDVYDYYAAEAEHALTLKKKYEKDKDKDSYNKLLKSDEYKWAAIYSRYKKTIKKYQEAIRAADTTKERMELMKQQDELKRKMIKEISEL